MRHSKDMEDRKHSLNFSNRNNIVGDIIHLFKKMHQRYTIQFKTVNTGDMTILYYSKVEVDKDVQKSSCRGG